MKVAAVRHAAALTAVAVGSLVGSAHSAQAKSPEPPTPPALVAIQEVPMTVVAFDAATARKAGNRITSENGDKVLRDPQGAELARIPKKGSGGKVWPMNQVSGNCGSSFFYLYDLTGAAFAMRTGFSVPSRAFDFDWYVNVRGENSFQTDNWDWSDAGPMWPSTSWTSGYVTSTQDTVAGTYYYGRVTYGQAFLVNGAVCTSGHPSAGQWMYK